ncbi:DUF2066 domain-containing protein [Candidatus Bodocaedibacter vickermanii]|uniref:DUF2066 domain-containing protein n=1 Tax=Candidatus Bodocaedibacter vickermanii TaxID=2741701 RepID=A0A7L9RUA9_9PROT|nr:DUF2066 domain-containing protein [Candidatus Paracaedibacteraceae bacterium 'Lake Konstanz']
MNKRLFLYVVALCLMTINASIVFGGAYSIQNIQVQNNGASSSVAKDAALKDARKQAFQAMVQKLVDKKDMDRFENTDDQTVEFLIDSMQIMNEQMGPQSYKAMVSFEFNKQRIEEFFRNKSVQFVVPVHKSIVVLPLLSDGAKTYLFEKENIWMDLWRGHSFNQALMTFVVPNGDLNDMQLLDAEDALIGASEKIAAVAARYQVSAVVVPYVSISIQGRKINVQVDFQEYDAKGIKKNNMIRSHNLTEVAAEVSKQDLLKKLLKISIENIQDFVKAQFGGNQNHNLVYLKVPTKTSDEYCAYIKVLNESGMAQEIQPVELSRNYSVLRVKTLYTLEDLLKFFKERGYNFEISQDVANPYAYEAKPKG